jgi:hypothetical protein
MHPIDIAKRAVTVAQQFYSANPQAPASSGCRFNIVQGMKLVAKSTAGSR